MHVEQLADAIEDRMLPICSVMLPSQLLAEATKPEKPNMQRRAHNILPLCLQQIFVACSCNACGGGALHEGDWFLYVWQRRCRSWGGWRCERKHESEKLGPLAERCKCFVQMAVDGSSMDLLQTHVKKAVNLAASSPRSSISGAHRMRHWSGHRLSFPLQCLCHCQTLKLILLSMSTR